jgi:hypothetical protein
MFAPSSVSENSLRGESTTRAITDDGALSRREAGPGFS